LDISDAESLENDNSQYSEMFSQIIVFILKCLDWNNGSQLAACRQRSPTTVVNTLIDNG